MVREHDCRDHEIEQLATPERPYHFVDSGLTDVFLAGIRYYTCSECRKQSAAIPALKHLLSAIARELVRQPSPLNGEEIRFLRKQLRKSSADLALMFDVTPETYSRWENDRQCPSPMADRLIRLYYTLESKDPILLPQVQNALDKVLLERGSRRRPPGISARIKGKEWVTEPRAAA
jgi:DNA-binding transcriptional regulator YiaG